MRHNFSNNFQFFWENITAEYYKKRYFHVRISRKYCFNSEDSPYTSSFVFDIVLCNMQSRYEVTSQIYRDETFSYMRLNTAFRKIRYMWNLSFILIVLRWPTETTYKICNFNDNNNKMYVLYGVNENFHIQIFLYILRNCFVLVSKWKFVGNSSENSIPNFF